PYGAARYSPESSPMTTRILPGWPAGPQARNTSETNSVLLDLAQAMRTAAWAIRMAKPSTIVATWSQTMAIMRGPLPRAPVPWIVQPWDQATSRSTSVLRRVAFEYGHVACAMSTRLRAASLCRPGRLTWSLARRKYSSPSMHRSTSASIARSSGYEILSFRAARPIAPSKHADQPAANSCSGFVPSPGPPGLECRTSRRPSLLRDEPSRPPVVRTLAVYRTLLAAAVADMSFPWEVWN